MNMAARQTITMIGAEEENSAEILSQIASGYSRLLLVTDGGLSDQMNALSDKIIELYPGAEVEVMDCVKDGCWEADIILLAGAGLTDKNLIERIREVATQKIVACIYFFADIKSARPGKGKTVQELLPYSKVLEAFIDRQGKEVQIAGEDPEAVAAFAALLKEAGYSLSATHDLPARTTSSFNQ